MGFDLGRLDGDHQRWVRVGLGDMEVLIRHVGPKDQERFRQKMIHEGIIKKQEGVEINSGRFEAFCSSFVRQYVMDWRNVVIEGVENPPYAEATMASLTAQWNSVMASIGEALREEAAFFSPNGDGSPG